MPEDLKPYQSAKGNNLKASMMLKRTSLVREVYRALINTGRSYAAFNDRDKLLIEKLKDRGEILDPTSGYGLLTRFCAEVGVSAYCVELNFPQHLWQILCHPSYTKFLMPAIKRLISCVQDWPHTHIRAVVHETWYPEQSKELLSRIFHLNKKILKESVGELECDKMALALLLPFIGRLACCIPGDISTHVKEGGICVYSGWQKDYFCYLQALWERLNKNSEKAVQLTHYLYHGDAKTFPFPARRFGAFVTSPPYPNMRDFSSMFEPERAFLQWFKDDLGDGIEQLEERVIGSNFVSGRPKRTLRNRAASNFIATLRDLKLNKNALYDEDKYYIPYYENYFADLEEAYANISHSLQDKVEGYIIVVNNTHRNIPVPVAGVIIGIWEDLGFNASIFEAIESFHVGVKNPRARGLRARHTEYVIKVWR